MSRILQPWHVALASLAGWINRQQQQAIEYQRAEIQVLREKLGTKRLLLDDDQRRRLAVKAKTLGRQRLEEIGSLFTPDTLLRGIGNWSLPNGSIATVARNLRAGRRSTPRSSNSFSALRK